MTENERGWLAANAPGGWIDDLRQDAARYRWLRIQGACEEVCDDTWRDLKHAGQLDAAIDAALMNLNRASPAAPNEGLSHLNRAVDGEAG